uniref:Uncharacterized protein n=1 Tax=Prolemur simus TaxID=1328070 RepID=A0A8C9ASP3_PROSS
ICSSPTMCLGFFPRMDIQEHNRELRSQLLEAKQQILDLREKLSISESTAFSLANQLQKYKCGECRDILESVLGVRLDFWEEEPAETLTLEDELRKHHVLVQNQARELTRLRQKLRDGREASSSFGQHLKTFQCVLRSHMDIYVPTPRQATVSVVSDK